MSIDSKLGSVQNDKAISVSIKLIEEFQVFAFKSGKLNEDFFELYFMK